MVIYNLHQTIDICVIKKELKVQDFRAVQVVNALQCQKKKKKNASFLY